MSTGTSSAPDVRIPNDIAGRLLDHGSASAWALHLTAYSIRSRGNRNNFVLNEGDVRKQCGLGERRWRAANALLTRTEVRERMPGGRCKGGRGAYARETWQTGGARYLSIPTELLTIRQGVPRLLGFVAAVLLDRMPRQATDIARRIGIRGRGAIGRYVSEAVSRGYIAAVRAGSGWIVARPDRDLGSYGHHHPDIGVQNGGVENVAVENVGVENVATHRSTEDSHSETEDDHSNLSAAACDASHTSSCADAVADDEEDDQVKGGEDGYVVLSDWRTARTMRDSWGDFPRLNPLPEYVTRTQWADISSHWGWVPPYLTTHAAHRQVMDIASVLHRLLDGTVHPLHILYGIAYRLHTTVKRHKRINNLAIVAQPLLETTQRRDTAWFYDLPSILDQDVQDQTTKWAYHYIGILRGRGIETDDRALLSTIAIERLSDTIRGATIESWPLAHAAEKIVHRVRVPAGQTIYGWDWVGEELCG